MSSRLGTHGLLALLPFALAAAGCGDPADEGERAGPPEPAVRDSAGVRIVAYGAALPRDAALRWQVADTPLTVVGRDGSRPGHALTEVVGLVVLGDGTLVVADGEASEIHLYDPDGTLRRTVGGRGDGPGEYRGIVALQRLDGAEEDPEDDGFVVFGAQRSAGDVYDARGERVDAVPLPRPEFFATGERRWRVLGMLGPDTVVLEGETDLRRPPLREGPNRVVHAVGLLVADGNGLWDVELLDSMAGSQVNVERTPAGGARYGAFAFPAFGRLEVGRRVWAAATDRWVVKGIDPREGRRLSIRVDEPRRPVTDADVADFWEVALGGREPSEAETDVFRRSLAEAPRAEAWPVLEDLHADRAGGVWVEDHRLRRGEPAVLDRFDPDGIWRGWLRLPAGYGPRRTVRDPGLFFDGDVVAGVWVSDLEVQEVRVYGIRRPDGPGGP